ncbi:MAG TPA: succinic semialdehyde dehydrogenase [Terriglobales bacterium]|jgi:succinate-semialdehyde dehydrogenase/glutarate-semialdehyde dehydrogenase|nr:succinic semialdehyde dehydrogenase [Terriglobales bacterium]
MALETATIRSVTISNPATGEVLRKLDCASPLEVKAAVGRVRAAQPAWQTTPIHHRLKILRRFQHLLTAQKSEIARRITSEVGKPIAEALLTEVLVVLDTTRFLQREAHSFLRPEPVSHGSLATKIKRGHMIRQPYGVIGIISPWNYPFSIPATETLAALVTGNAVVLKPSELTPLSALLVADLLVEAGLPADLLQVVIGDGATGAALVESEIDKLIFTGSVTTGKRIAQMAGQRLLPVVLELGGKDPMIVLENADLDVASSGAIWGAYVNAGQACLSVERCYVQRSIYDKFVAACVEKTKQLRVGNGMEANTDVGPLIQERQLRTVEAHVADACARGAKLCCGGERLPSLGPNYYAPTVLADVTHEMRILREETFGPVLPIMPFDSDEDAVHLANDSEYGLAASVWTKDRARGESLARRIHAGTVMVNDAVSCFGISEAPHGGMKASGIGRTHGRLGLEEMVRIKYLDSDLLPGMKKPWWYGYGANVCSAAEGFLDFQFARGVTSKIRGAVNSAGLLFRNRR